MPPLRISLAYFQSPRGVDEVLARIATEPGLVVEVRHGVVLVATIYGPEVRKP